MLKTLNPNLNRSPYYIVAPRYIRTSAGTRCLHLLCHWLNRLGERAFVAIWYADKDAPSTSVDLQTPLLTQAIIDYHFELGVQPIILYPEVIVGNPLQAGCVTRWILNFPGLLGGDAVYPESEMVIAFSKVLARAFGTETPVLHMPVLDENVFHPGEKPHLRSGTAFYAAKYKDVHNGTVFGVPEGAIEITRGKRDSQTPQEIAKILRSVERLYVFENTALATEAVLCGCPAVFMPNPWLDKPIALEELGWDGLAWGDDPSEIARACATVKKGRDNYHRTIDEFFRQLNLFITKSQEKAAEYPYENKIDSNFLVTELLLYPPLRSILSARQLDRLVKMRPQWHLSEWYAVNRAVASAIWRCEVRDRIRRWRKSLTTRANNTNNSATLTSGRQKR